MARGRVEDHDTYAGSDREVAGVAGLRPRDPDDLRVVRVGVPQGRGPPRPRLVRGGQRQVEVGVDDGAGQLRGVDRFGARRFDIHDAGATANRKCVAWSVDSTARWISGVAASPKCSNIRVPEPSSTGTR